MPLDTKTADLMLTDFGAWENTLDDVQRQNLESTFRFEPDRVAAQKRFAAVANVAAHTGRDVEEVSNRFEDYYMHAFARDEERGLGLAGGVKDVNEFYGLLTKRANDNLIKAETLKSASSAAFDSALRGGSSVADFAAWQVENEHLPEAFGNAYKVWQKTRADVENELGPDGRAAAARAFRAMRSITGASQESDAWINEAKQDLINLRVRSPKAYKLALAAVQLMAADSGKVEKGVGQGMAENAGRVISDIGASFMFARPIVEMSEDASQALVKAGITNAENPERLAAQIRARREVEDDIRDMSRGVIDPVKTEREGWTGWAESAAYMGASSLPYMVSVMVPGGTSAAAGSFTSDSYDEFRSNGWEGPSAAAGAIVSGVFQAAVEKASEFITKIPGVAAVFNKFGVKPGSSWATQFLIRSGVRSGVEVGEEVIQEATTPFIQELTNAIMPSIPDTPEGKHLSDVMGRFFEADNFAPLLLSVLPLGLVGAAMSTSQDMDLMEDAKLFFGDDAAAQIMAETDPAKRDAMIRDKFKALPAGEFIKRARQGMESAMDRMKARFQDQESIKALQDTSSPEYTVDVTRSPRGWQVRTGDGSVIDVDSAEAARRIAVDLRQVASQQEADALVNVIDDYYSAGRQADTVITGETVKAGRGGVFGVRRDAEGNVIAIRAFDSKALETIRQEAEVAGIKTGTADIFAHVNGSNEIFPMRVGDTAKGILRRMSLYKSQSEGQPQVITFLHEDIESKLMLGLADGVWTENDIRTAFRALAPAFENVAKPELKAGQKMDDVMESKLSEFNWQENVRKLARGEGDSTMLRETFSEMYVRDRFALDRMGRATGMRPGSISRAIEAAVMGAKTQAEASAFKRILAVLRAFSAYLKGVFGTVKAIVKARDEGKIGEEWDAFVNKVLGIDEVKQMEGEAVKEAQEIMDAGNMAFSTSRALPADSSNVTVMPDAGSTFSLGKITSAQDAEYMQAVESGDMAKAQRMVDEAAKAADVTYVAKVPISRISYGELPGVGEDRKLRDGDAAPIILERTEAGDTLALADGYHRLEGMLLNGETEVTAIILNSSDSESVSGLGEQREFRRIQEEHEGESADPVTYDDQGNVIPLSQRFNSESPDIRFSISPIRNLNELSDQVERQFKENPAGALEVKSKVIRQFAKLRDKWSTERWTPKGDKIRPISEKRTVKSLDKEQAYRKRARQRELIDEGMMQLTPETLMAYSQGVATLEKDPLVSKMLNDHGRLMSKATAEEQGKNIADLYDDAVWIPPQWYAKGAGITPDVMANNLGFDTASEMWAALDSAIKTHRSAKEGYAKAEKAVRDVEKKALEQATKEAQAWRDEADKMQSEDWSPRESLVRDLITLEAIVAMFPQEIRGKIGGFVTLARKASESARLKVLQKQLERGQVLLEKHLKDQYGEAVERLFDKYRPERKAGEKPKGKLDPDAQEIADKAESAMGLNADEVNAEIAKINTLLDADNISAEDEAKFEAMRELVQLLGDWKNADSARRESAFLALNDVLSEGWAKWKLKQILKREQREEMRKALKSATGKKGVGIERDKMKMEAAKVLGKAARWVLNLSSFGEVMRAVFGEKAARQFIDNERNASNQYEDAIQQFSERIDEFFTTLAGGVLRGERLRFDLAQPTLTIGAGGMNERQISQLQGIQALLMWQQEDGKRHMEGPRDENGAPIEGKWSYDQAWIDELTSKLSPEAVEVKKFIEQLYSEEWAPLNAVYRERHGVNLPRHDMYAPITVTPQQAKAGEMVDPVSGAAIAGSILTPGSLRSRNRSALAEPEFRDALATFIAHTKQMEHWKAYYDLAVEMQSVLGNRDVANSVKAAVGDEGATVLRKWVDVFAQGGTRDAAAGLAVSDGLGRLSGRVATVGLLGRFSTLLVQSTQLAAASVKMPVGSYLKRFALLMSGNLGWSDAINSEFIQRRIKSAPPLIRQAMQSLGEATRPNQIQRVTRHLGQLLSGADGLFTAGTYAILLDYHRTQGAKMGLEGEALESYAHAEAVNATEQVAQPVRTGARSIIEVTNTNPLAKMSWAYASEARQKMALFAWSAYNAKNDPAGAAKTAFLVFVIGGLMSQVLKNLWREAKGDDDEKKWSPERLTLSMLSPITSAIPGAAMIAGEGGSLSGAKYAQYAIKDVFDGDADMKDVDTILSVLGYFNDTAAGIATLSHAGYDFAQVLENAFGEE